jgi:hypothetical protein
VNAVLASIEILDIREVVLGTAAVPAGCPQPTLSRSRLPVWPGGVGPHCPQRAAAASRTAMIIRVSLGYGGHCVTHQSSMTIARKKNCGRGLAHEQLHEVGLAEGAGSHCLALARNSNRRRTACTHWRTPLESTVARSSEFRVTGCVGPRCPRRAAAVGRTAMIIQVSLGFGGHCVTHQSSMTIARKNIFCGRGLGWTCGSLALVRRRDLQVLKMGGSQAGGHAGGHDCAFFSPAKSGFEVSILQTPNTHLKNT